MKDKPETTKYGPHLAEVTENTTNKILDMFLSDAGASYDKIEKLLLRTFYSLGLDAEYDFQWPDLCQEQERKISKLKDLLREVEAGWNNFDGAPFEDGEISIMDKVRKAIQ